LLPLRDLLSFRKIDYKVSNHFYSSARGYEEGKFYYDDVQGKWVYKGHKDWYYVNGVEYPMVATKTYLMQIRHVRRTFPRVTVSVPCHCISYISRKRVIVS
jgi:hypothetical protein